ncbi:hypothetical protein Pcac1_g27081 [Phytophthora cactorum]|uniref:Uncharacterized protein n=3 Tax=Phytophthora cactorum TaxID=29920 RepID=A0A329RPY7_9STRA|nr:hypothetical protein Pcac1_g27081 [Phytophthora cactorum]RAW26793.1 hypothetical protein PC110_g16807 [Phytophthora cactorum]
MYTKLRAMLCRQYAGFSGPCHTFRDESSRCIVEFSQPFCICSAPAAASRLDDEDNENEQVVIVHSLSSQPNTRTSRVRFITTVDDIRVSLTLMVTACRSGLNSLQQATATWAFSAAHKRPQRFVGLVQAPTHAVSFVTSSLFEAYAADRLQFAARRHAEWTTGSKLGWTPRVVSGTTAAAIKELESKVPTRSQRHDEKHVTGYVTKKRAKMYRLQRKTNIHPRYLDYEQTPAYSSKRQENLARRQALESNQHGVV